VYHREVVLYTCRHSLRCWLAKRFLSRQGYPYEVVDTTDTLELVVELSKSVQHKVTLLVWAGALATSGGGAEEANPDAAGAGSAVYYPLPHGKSAALYYPLPHGKAAN